MGLNPRHWMESLVVYCSANGIPGWMTEVSCGLLQTETGISKYSFKHGHWITLPLTVFQEIPVKYNRQRCWDKFSVSSQLSSLLESSIDPSDKLYIKNIRALSVQWVDCRWKVRELWLNSIKFKHYFWIS